MKSPFRVLAFLCLAACGPAAAADPPPDTPATLLAEYRSLGLPLPPASARLVAYDVVLQPRDGKVPPPRIRLAFELKPGTKTERPILLRGTTELPADDDQPVRAVDPVPAATKGFVTNFNDTLSLAVQCQWRGWDALANKLLAMYRKQIPTPPREVLADTAWNYWCQPLSHPTADRRPAAKRLRELLKRYPALDTGENRALVRSLDAALAPGTGRPGSVDALIDALVDHHEYPRWFTAPGDKNPCRPIIDLGFDAVPALIAHLDDNRLTRHYAFGFNNDRGGHIRLGNVVAWILNDLAGQYIFKSVGSYDKWGMAGRLLMHAEKTAVAEAWWNKARKTGEEAYLLTHVLPPPAEDGKSRFVNSVPLRVIAVKYPKHVPVLYRTVLDSRSDVGSGELADAVAALSLPAKEKVALLTVGTKHKDLNHRLPALVAALKDLDMTRFNDLLLATIEGFPRDVRDEYWYRPEGHVAALAVETADPRVWTAVETAAKLASVGLRMELLREFGDPIDTRRRAERLRLLAEFLDDTAVRDVTADPRFDGPGAGFPYPRITVRDFVAVELAQLQGVRIACRPERTAAEWATIRQAVRDELKRELGPK